MKTTSAPALGGIETVWLTLIRADLDRPEVARCADRTDLPALIGCERATDGNASSAGDAKAGIRKSVRCWWSPAGPKAGS